MNREMLWRPWLVNDARLDPVTGERSCSINNVVLSPFSEVVAFTRRSATPVEQRKPPTRRPFAAFGRDVPIPRELLLAAGYTTTRESRFFRLDDVTGCHKIHKRYTRKVAPC